MSLENDQIEGDIISLYRSLWEHNDGSRTFLVMHEDVLYESDLGRLVVSPEVDPHAVLQRGIQNGGYPEGSFLVEVVADLSDNIN